MKPQDDTQDVEVPLSGGGRTTVHRRGRVVLRDAGPWTPTVHALLRHLENVGFAGAPRIVGSGFNPQGRETLTYIDGEFVHPGPWNDTGVAAIGRMLRQLHEATQSFSSPDNPIWRPWFGRTLGGPQVVGHCDTGPWNIVAQSGLPVALIDWENAGPVDPLTELAQACWLNVKLHDDDIAERVGLPPVGVRAQQLRLVVDAYGLSAAQRTRLMDRMVEVAIRDAADQAIEAGITPDSVNSGPLWGLAWRARSAAWILRHRSVLEQALRS